MKKVILGNTGHLISELCLGTMYFGTKVPQNESHKLLDHFIQAGGNFIDTANCYAFWRDNGVGDESENVIGQWLKTKKRDSLVIATKCGGRPVNYIGDLDTVQLEGLSYDTIIESVEKCKEPQEAICTSPSKRVRPGGRARKRDGAEAPSLVGWC